MDVIEKRAWELLADALGMSVAALEAYGDTPCIVSAVAALPAIIAALTPPEGSDQHLLELAATFETCIPFLPSAGQRNIGKAVAQLRHMAMGYVLVPVQPTEAMLRAHAACGRDAFAVDEWAAMLAARPEVP